MSDRETAYGNNDNVGGSEGLAEVVLPVRKQVCHERQKQFRRLASGPRLRIEPNVRTQAQHLRTCPASAAVSNRRAR